MRHIKQMQCSSRSRAEQGNEQAGHGHKVQRDQAPTFRKTEMVQRCPKKGTWLRAATSPRSGPACQQHTEPSP